MRIVSTILGAWAALASPAWPQVPSFPSPSELAGKTAGELVLRPGKYGASDADWGFLLVPENRERTDSRLIHVALVRQRARSGASEPPIYNLVGGPGQSNVFGSGELPPELTEHSEVVRVGYRGIDGNVELKCPEYVRALQTENPLAPENIAKAHAALRSCHARLSDSGIDLDGYDLAEVVADIEAARAALGHEQLDFLAVSWGTQIALAYAAHHPGKVRRMFLVGAGGRARGFDLWDPGLIEEKLRRYGELWKADPRALARAPDILATIRGVLAELPQEWNGVRIDADKVRLGLWTMLASPDEAAQAFDAFVAAQSDDWSGLAFLSWSYDEEQRRALAERYGEYFGEFFCKTMSSGLDPERDWIEATRAEGTLLGSPLARLLWSAGSRGGWPVDSVATDFCRDPSLSVPTLILMGELDFSAPPEYVERELLPTLENGRLVVLPAAGHVDFIRAQPRAFERALVRFLREGVADTSFFVERDIDFTPAETLGALARRLLPAGER